MTAARGAIRWGTSSWSEPSWVGAFYPVGTPARDFLAVYAERFSAVEADTTYYAVPAPALVRGWDAKTPAAFRLCAKFPRSVVHAGAGPKPDGERVLVSDEARADRDAFLAAMRLLGDKSGPLVLQFPYFNREAFAGPEPFLARLDAFLAALPADFRYAVEVRNAAWLEDELLAVLRARRVALVLVELAYLPFPWKLAERLDLVTTDFLYARLIGDRKAVEARTRSFDRVVLDKGRSLERWAELLRGLAPAVRETYCFANNHYAGHGPATIAELARRVEPDAPPLEVGPGPPRPRPKDDEGPKPLELFP